mgnify:CR=1 FL=1
MCSLAVAARCGGSASTATNGRQTFPAAIMAQAVQSAPAKKSSPAKTISPASIDTEQKPETVNVRKVWVIDDGGQRPDSVCVQLMRDGEPFGDPVTLSDANDWSHAWKDLESGHNWTVVELNVPDGFKATVSQSGDTFTIINDDTTEDPDDPTDIPDPEKPDTDDPDDPTDIPDTEKPDDNKDPDNPTTPSNPSTPSSPSTPSHSTTPGTSGTTTTTTTDKSDDKDAPQTGDNTHTRALFALCLASLAGMTVIGVSRKRQRKNDSDQS